MIALPQMPTRRCYPIVALLINDKATDVDNYESIVKIPNITAHMTTRTCDLTAQRSLLRQALLSE